jgi:hypothetical protein
MKPDKDCFVRPLVEEGYYVCRSKDTHRNTCPYLMYHALEADFCTYLDRHKIPEGC